MSELTEVSAIRLLLRDRWRRSFCLPTYTPRDWWENDLFEITKSDYWREYEIKLTLQDFKRDADKRREIAPIEWKLGVYDKPATFENKHAALALKESGPIEFYYVAPEKVIPIALLPAWSGLIELYQDGGKYYERVIVKAPRRHRRKIDPAIRQSALETCYWRMHRLLP